MHDKAWLTPDLTPTLEWRYQVLSFQAAGRNEPHRAMRVHILSIEANGTGPAGAGREANANRFVLDSRRSISVRRKREGVEDEFQQGVEDHRMDCRCHHRIMRRLGVHWSSGRGRVARGGMRRFLEANVCAMAVCITPSQPAFRAMKKSAQCQGGQRRRGRGAWDLHPEVRDLPRLRWCGKDGNRQRPISPARRICAALMCNAMSDGELFYHLKNGIRAHGHARRGALPDRKLWQVTSLICAICPGVRRPLVAAGRRPAQSATAGTAHYVGSAACKDCHTENLRSLEEDPHGERWCRTRRGPSEMRSFPIFQSRIRCSPLPRMKLR